MRSFRNITRIGLVTAAMAGALATASPAMAGNGQDYVDGDWVNVYFSAGDVMGTTGGVHSRIYLDRATSPNPSRWDGWLASNSNSGNTHWERAGDYWWRTCWTNGDNAFHCGGWYHQ
jgi:hypothetical protein